MPELFDKSRLAELVEKYRVTEFFYFGVDEYGCTYEGTVWHRSARLAREATDEIFSSVSFVYFRLVA